MTVLLRIRNFIEKGLYLEPNVLLGNQELQSPKYYFVDMKTANYCKGIVYKISVLYKTE